MHWLYKTVLTLSYWRALLDIPSRGLIDPKKIACTAEVVHAVGNVHPLLSFTVSC
jgi:hypothetical protein